MSSEEVLTVSSENAPYFRTPEFSEIMFENERMMLDLLHAPSGSRCVFLTAFGTGTMGSSRHGGSEAWRACCGSERRQFWAEVR